MGRVLSSIASSVVDRQQRIALEKILAKKVTMEDFTDFDIDGDGRIEKSEFVMRKLLLMGILKLDDVERCEKEFEVMDVDGSGGKLLVTIMIQLYRSKFSTTIY